MHSFEKPPLKEAVVVKLMHPPVRFLPFPHRVRYVVLQYSFEDEESIVKTFMRGHSYAEVLDLRHPQVVGKGSFAAETVSRLGFADVFPWPKPSSEEIKAMISREQAH